MKVGVVQDVIATIVAVWRVRFQSLARERRLERHQFRNVSFEASELFGDVDEGIDSLREHHVDHQRIMK